MNMRRIGRTDFFFSISDSDNMFSNCENLNNMIA